MTTMISEDGPGTTFDRLREAISSFSLLRKLEFKSNVKNNPTLTSAC